ncbi:MAG TPA: hypothetical protein VET89_01475 [Stellaceae bacterium]|nr:hypothetical protein [Stellaceae bacterium]
MANGFPDLPPLSADESAQLSVIWDKLYALYLAKANGDRSEAEIDAEIETLIQQRNAIRSWGWNTGRNWRDDLPPGFKP